MRLFDSVILLTGSGELALLSARLISCRPDLRVIAATTAADLRAIDPPTLSRSRLVAFTTLVVVPGDILAQLGYGAYNFHPGPPEYPGLSPAHFALYDGARGFGATAHRMVARVDSGPIVAVARFDVADGASLHSLEIGAFQQLARLFWDLSAALATQESPLDELPVAWGHKRSTRRSTEAMCAISPEIEAAELHRRVAAFGHSPLDLRPTVTLHGYRFRLEAVEAEPAIGAEPAPLRTENTAVPSAA